MEILRVPSGWELFSLRFLKVQVPFSNVAAEQDPFTEKLIDPLSSGMLNLSADVKVVLVWACASVNIGKNSKTMTRTIESAVKAFLVLFAIKSHVGYHTLLGLGYKSFQQSPFMLDFACQQ